MNVLSKCHQWQRVSLRSIPMSIESCFNTVLATTLDSCEERAYAVCNELLNRRFVDFQLFDRDTRERVLELINVGVLSPYQQQNIAAVQEK